MTKLQKIFPLSFKFADNWKRLLLGILFYLLIEIGARVALSYALAPVLSYAILLPLIVLAMIVALPLFIIGVLLCFILPPLGIVIIFVGAIPIYVILIAYSCLLSVISGFITAYVLTGITVQFLAYGGMFGEIN